MNRFGRSFPNLDSFYREHLSTLENEGCVYEQQRRDETNEFEFCRIRFQPHEIVEFVDAMTALDEFREYEAQGLSPERALNAISDTRIKQRVEEYNEWALSSDSADLAYCPAAFLGEDLESLLTGGETDRYEFFQESYTADRRFLLPEIIRGFSEAVSILRDRRGDRPGFEITCEQDVQNLFHSLIKPIFPDSRAEEYTRKDAGNSKRIDFVIPEINAGIEIKFIRDEGHARKVADELKVDFESYHKHPDCSQLFAVVWDEEKHIIDRSNFEKDLTGPREIDGTRLNIETRILP